MRPAPARHHRPGGGLRLFLVFALVCAAAQAAGNQGDVARGEYVFRAAGCAGCHTDRDNHGPFLAGGRALSTPFGTFYAPNITPDPRHGIGGWTRSDFVRAMSRGVAPDGSHYYPVFPYTSYTRMRRDDLLALRAYLDQVPPVARPNRPHDIAWYLSFRPLMAIWKWLFFTPGTFENDPARPPEWNRGAYLARAMAHCGECHTPRNRLGVADVTRRLAGTRNGPEGKPVPNITPHPRRGIGRWDLDDLVYYLKTGMTPGGDFAGGLMAEVIDDGLRHLTDSDRKAVAAYVKSVPPVDAAIDENTEKGGRKRDEFAY
jgi:mono/diheme cytochrome c family protein